MSGMLPDGMGQEMISGTFSRHEWSVLLTCVYKAPLPLELTHPVAAKLQVLLSPQPAQAREEAP